MAERLDTPKAARRTLLPRVRVEQDAFGKISEGIARFMGTPRFLLYMTVFCLLWLGFNTWGPESLRFDSAALGFTALTLMLSLQASYSAPLILLAQNRQTDRDRVSAEQDRQRGERNLADTEYLAREMAALRIALSEVATRDFVRSEIRNLLEELDEKETERAEAAEAARGDGTEPGLDAPLPRSSPSSRSGARDARRSSGGGRRAAAPPEPR
ncbi:DUF1003 domain-containing protein [Oerskovia merdavium]|uniref:DUF1003 domain-containing protein n=1 Tax=Oerskovia merdavium TaxID=2762227 RepID=A0ABR8TVM1_9CELL|nr:DUF1003 domain-containing protein [Oerskovia merdavium]MBD7979837.1 DUF1003 domain-containing protein [Oerskovia merdavium]